MAFIHDQDIGLKITLDCVIDISSATSRSIKYQKPGGTTGSWTAAEESTTEISYTTTTGDIDESGVWIFQAYVNKGAYKIRGEKVETEIQRIVA
ncbi:MAG: hypothetical protein ACYS1A_20495 [Planctomycetota bacterium]|jgi:hypothetical protein